MAASTSPMGRVPPWASRRSSSGLAREQLHHEEYGAVLVHVVVEHGHGAGVLDPVGHISLAEETRAHHVVVRGSRVQHLHRRALAVAVGGRVDARHPADAEQGVEVPLVSQHRADARARLLRGAVG